MQRRIQKITGFVYDESLHSKSTVITGDGALESDPEFTEENYKFGRY
jgi:hypothetical protein